MKQAFIKYTSVGVLNTSVHWSIFALLYWSLKSQAIANVTAFLIAVTMSYFINAKWTFEAKMSVFRYGLMVAFMAFLTLSYGYIADHFSINPILTLVASSGTGLILGFLFSHFVVFKHKR